MSKTPAQFSITVNGESCTVRTHPMKRLIDVLREDLLLTGTKEGCGEGECGSCSVRMNGELINSCLVPVLQAEGATIETVEGLLSIGPTGAVTFRDDYHNHPESRKVQERYL